MQPETIAKISEHYEHAKEKHPSFCNALTYYTKSGGTHLLSMARHELKLGIETGTVGFQEVLNCEVMEALKEIVDGNTAAAVEECYDAIAVLLRVVDVLEGRHALGDLAKKSNNN